MSHSICYFWNLDGLSKGFSSILSRLGGLLDVVISLHKEAESAQ